jgi:hypothetical protein
MRARIVRVFSGSVTRHLRRTGCTSGNLEPVGIGIEQGCEFEQPSFHAGVTGFARKATYQFRFMTNGGNLFLAHKPRYSSHT